MKVVSRTWRLLDTGKEIIEKIEDFMTSFTLQMKANFVGVHQLSEQNFPFSGRRWYSSIWPKSGKVFVSDSAEAHFPFCSTIVTFHTMGPSHEMADWSRTLLLFLSSSSCTPFLEGGVIRNRRYYYGLQELIIRVYNMLMEATEIFSSSCFGQQTSYSTNTKLALLKNYKLFSSCSKS